MPETEAIGMDLCDRCGTARVPAIYRFELRAASIAFCMHHSLAHIDVLTTMGWTMYALPARSTLVDEARNGGRALPV